MLHFTFLSLKVTRANLFHYQFSIIKHLIQLFEYSIIVTFTAYFFTD
jgi:hypothetical protein